VHLVSGDFWASEHAIVAESAADVDPRWLAHLLRLMHLGQYSMTTAQPGIGTSQINALAVPLPSSEEQRVIADYLDHETAQIDTLIAEQERLIELLRERRTAVVDSVISAGLNRDVETKDSGVSWVGRVPAHWTVRPLWSMFRRVKDVDHPGEQMLSVFRDYGVVAKASRDNINQTAENRSIYQLVHPGWLVSNRMKAWQGSVGISSLRGIVSGHYICFEPLHDEDPDYLNWLFRSDRYAAGYGLISRGVRIGQAEIDNDSYRVLPVVVPPVAEQREIAAYLTQKTLKIELLIAGAHRLIELAQERRAALVTAAVTGQIEVREAS
jgi:restriction endonuclease S subunit